MKSVIGVLAVVLLAASAPLAHASLQIQYQVDGGAVVTCATGADSGPGSCSAVVGDLDITLIQGTSNAPGGPVNAKELGDTLEILTTNSHTLNIWITAQNFTFPVTPPDISFGSNLSTTSVTGIGTAGLTSCVDTSNSLPQPFCPVGPSLTNTTLGYSGVSANSDSKTSTITSLSAPFSLSEQISLSLGVNSDLNVITSTVLTQVPEPMSIVLLGGALLACGAFLRRKKCDQSA